MMGISVSKTTLYQTRLTYVNEGYKNSKTVILLNKLTLSFNSSDITFMVMCIVCSILITIVEE